MMESVDKYWLGFWGMLTATITIIVISVLVSKQVEKVNKDRMTRFYIDNGYKNVQVISTQTYTYEWVKPVKDK